MISDTTIIYIVDDEEGIRELLSSVVKLMGLTAASYADADSFLDAYEPDKPGCLVLDIEMPGLSGLELQEKLVSSQSGLPIVMMSGKEDMPMVNRAMTAGAAGFLRKPFTIRAFIDQVEQAIGRRTSA